MILGDSMKKIVVLFVILFLTGCNSKETFLVCKGKVKKCTYEPVAASTIGEEMYVCEGDFGIVEATFNYDDNNKWKESTFVTKYYEDQSTDEIYEELMATCNGKCEIEYSDDQIIVTEKYSSNEYQNGSLEEMKKYMSNLDFECE